MVISVNIPDGTERMLAEQAAMRGQSVESDAAELIRKGVTGSWTFAEILAPFRAQVESSGMQDAELDGCSNLPATKCTMPNKGQSNWPSYVSSVTA